MDTFWQIRIPYPDILEKQKIANFLSAIDEKLATKKEKLAALEEMKKGLLQQIFSQQLRFKADDGSEFPEWATEKMNALGDFDKRKTLSKAGITKTGTPMILYGELYNRYNEVT